MVARKVAVIGAGAGGLTAIKCCLDEGLDVVCFERTDSIGGLWHYTEEVRDGQACVMKSTVINTSKEMMCFSDFPIPKEFPNFMPNLTVMKYFNLYADHFDLKKYIRFRTEILSVTPSSDNITTGRWDVRIKDRQTGCETLEKFDGVLICTGHHADINNPSFPGQEQFKGRVLHSHDYKLPRGFEDKRIVVVGIGNSGADVIVELSQVASQVFLSTRRGTWVFHKISKHGIPFDMALSRRFTQQLVDLFPAWYDKHAVKEMNERFDHKLYSLEPKHMPSQQHPTSNDVLFSRISTGSVKVKGNLKKFTATGVEFEDGTFEDNIDAVILATGYMFGFPFLDKKVLEVKKNVANLYKRIFVPDRQYSTLAIIGCCQPLGSLVPISEMQCRVATRVIKGDITLPSSAEMTRETQQRQEAISSRYVTSLRHTMQVDYVPYLQELSEFMGCKPNILKLFLTDPKLAWHCYFGPCVPSTFRLTGPGTWSGARDAILTVWNRHDYPLRTRDIGTDDVTKTGRLMSFRLLSILVIAVALVVRFCCF